MDNDQKLTLMRKMIDDTCRIILDPSVVDTNYVWVNYTYDEAEYVEVLNKPHWEDMSHYCAEDFIQLYITNDCGFKGGHLFLMQKELPPPLVYDHERRSESFG